MRWRGLACAVIGLLLGAGNPGTDDVKKPADLLQGGWSMVRLLVNGEELPADQATSGELVVEDDEYRPKLGATVEASAFKVDATRSPKTIDFRYTGGFLKGQTIKGIYKINGDEMTICRGLSPENERPEVFAAPADSGLLLVVWKRSKTVGAEKMKAVHNELKRFDATWRFVSVEVEGISVPPERFQEDRLILKGKQFTSKVRGTETQGFFAIDPTLTPKTIDIKYAHGAGKDIIQKGIYELEGDTQKICIAAPGKPRPSDFGAQPKSGHMVQVLERVKP